MSVCFHIKPAVGPVCVDCTEQWDKQMHKGMRSIMLIGCQKESLLYTLRVQTEVN